MDGLSNTRTFEIDIIKESFLSIYKKILEDSHTRLFGITIGIRWLYTVYDTHMYVRSLYSQSDQFRYLRELWYKYT